MSDTTSLTSLSQRIDLAVSSTDNIIKRIKRDFYVRTYKEAPFGEEDSEVKEKRLQVNKMIEEAWKTNYGSDFNYAIFKKAMPVPVWCMGPPGQGKTASFLVAAQEFANEAGFRFIPNVTNDYVPNVDGLDFPVVIQETAGENSAITFGGVPRAEEVIIKKKDGSILEKKHVLKRALNYRFTVFSQCAGGLLLFDDAANASTMIQNVLLPVAQFNTFQDLMVKAMVGFTGNLGALDGTHTSEISSALLTRVASYYVTDNVDDYIKRGYATFNDELGDLGYLSFLKRNEKDFAELPRTGARSGFACPRTHSNFIQGSRLEVQTHGGRGKGEEAAMFAIQALATSMYGAKYATKVISFYQSYIKGVDPLARAAIVEGKLNATKIKQEYKNGTSSESMSFGYQFSTACGDYFVTEIGRLLREKNIALEGDKIKEVQMKEFIQSPEFDKLAKNYGEAILLLSTQEFSFSLDHAKKKLVSYAPALSVVSGTTRDMHPLMGDTLARLINASPSCTAEHTDIMVETITGVNRGTSVFSAGRSTTQRRTGGSWD